MQSETYSNGEMMRELFKQTTQADNERVFANAFRRPGITEIKQEQVGRNDPCPCGSGKKFEKCCLGQEWKRELAKCSICGEFVTKGALGEHTQNIHKKSEEEEEQVVVEKAIRKASEEIERRTVRGRTNQ